jgi:hypothetical protein
MELPPLSPSGLPPAGSHHPAGRSLIEPASSRPDLCRTRPNVPLLDAPFRLLEWSEIRLATLPPRDEDPATSTVPASPGPEGT